MPSDYYDRAHAARTQEEADAALDELVARALERGADQDAATIMSLERARVVSAAVGRDSETRARVYRLYHRPQVNP